MLGTQIHTISSLVPLYDDVEENMQVIHSLSEEFFQNWSQGDLVSLINLLPELMSELQSQDAPSHVHMEEPLDFLCFNCVQLLSFGRLPVVVRPPGLVSDEVYFKYISTVITYVHSNRSLLDDSQVQLLFEQFVNTLFDELQQFLQPHEAEHSQFVVQIVNVLISLEMNASCDQFLDFLIKAGILADKWLRVQIIATIIKTKLLAKKGMRYCDETLELIEFGTRDILQSEKLNILPTALHLSAAVLLHQLMEVLDSFQTSRQLGIICTCLQRFTKLQPNNSVTFDDTMLAILSCAMIVLSKLASQLEQNKNDVYVVEQAHTEFVAMVRSITSFANKVFVQLATSTQLKSYGHQFNQYYVQFVKFMSSLSKLELPTEQISSFDIQEHSEAPTTRVTDQITTQMQFTQQNARDIYEQPGSDQSFQSEQQRINQLFIAIINVPLGRSREELLEQARLAVNLDEFLPEYGQIIQFYAKTELPASVLRLFTHIFLVEPPSERQMMDILLHPGTKACLGILRRFKKQPNAVKTFAISESRFFEATRLVLKWFAGPFTQALLDEEKTHKLVEQLEILVALFQATMQEFGINLTLTLVEYGLLEALLSLLSCELLVESSETLGVDVSIIVLRAFDTLDKYFHSAYAGVAPETHRQLGGMVPQWHKITQKALFSIMDLRQITPLQKQIMLANLCQSLAWMISVSGDAFDEMSRCLQQYKKIFTIVTIVHSQETPSQESLLNTESLGAVTGLLGMLVYQMRKRPLTSEISPMQQYVEQQLYSIMALTNLIKKLLQAGFPRYQPKCYGLLLLADIFNVLAERSYHEQDPAWPESSGMMLVANVAYGIWSVLSYSLNLGTILFVIPRLFEVLQRTRVGSRLCSQLFVRGFLGCQAREKKKWSGQEQLQDLINCSNISLRFLLDEYSRSRKCLNSRIDQDFARIGYLLTLSQIQFSTQTIAGFLYYPQLTACDIIRKNAFAGLFEMPLRHSEESISSVVLSAVQNTPMSLSAVHFVLLFLQILSTYPLQPTEWEHIQQQLEKLAAELQPYWGYKLQLIIQEINGELEESLAQLQKLYPNKRLKPLKVTEETLTFFDTQHVMKALLGVLRTHRLAGFALFSGIWHQAFLLLNAREVQQFIELYGPFELGTAFRQQIFALGEAREHLDVQQKKIMQTQIQQAYEAVYSWAQKAIQSLQKSQQVIQANRIRQALFLLQLAIMQCKHTPEDIYKLVLKHTASDFNTQNFAYDQKEHTRRQRQDYHLTKIGSSQLHKIIAIDEDHFVAWATRPLGQESSIIQQDIVSLAETYGVIVLFIAVETLCSGLQKNNPQLKYAGVQYVWSVLDYLRQFLTVHEYHPEQNETTLCSELVMKYLVQLPTILDAPQLAPLCFTIILQISSLQATVKQTLLINNDHRFLELLQRVFAEDYARAPLCFGKHLDLLQQFYQILAKSCVTKLQTQFQQQEIRQVREARQHLQRTADPLLQSLLLSQEVEKYYDSVAIQAIQSKHDEQFVVNHLCDSFVHDSMALLNAILIDNPQTYTALICNTIIPLLKIKHLLPDLLADTDSIASIFCCSIFTAPPSDLAAVFSLAGALLEAIPGFLHSDVTPDQATQQMALKTIDFIVYGLCTSYKVAFDGGNLLKLVLLQDKNVISFANYPELEQPSIQHRSPLFDGSPGEQKRRFIEQKLDSLLGEIQIGGKPRDNAIIGEILAHQAQGSACFQLHVSANIFRSHFDVRIQ